MGHRSPYRAARADLRIGEDREDVRDGRDPFAAMRGNVLVAAADESAVKQAVTAELPVGAEGSERGAEVAPSH